MIIKNFEDCREHPECSSVLDAINKACYIAKNNYGTSRFEICNKGDCAGNISRLWHPNPDTIMVQFHRQFYKCCESGSKCLGFPPEFAPWDCLRNPLWPPCEVIQSQCEAHSVCAEHFHTASSECLGTCQS